MLVAARLSNFAGDMLKFGVDFGLYRLALSVESSRRRRELAGLLEELLVGLVSTPSARLLTNAVRFELICGKNGVEMSFLLPCTTRGEIRDAERI